MCDVATRLENIGLQKGLAEDDTTLIQKIMDAAKELAPEYDIDAIYKKVAKSLNLTILLPYVTKKYNTFCLWVIIPAFIIG